MRLAWRRWRWDGYILSLEVWMAVSVIPLLPDGKTGVSHVLHATDHALSTAKTAVSASSAAAVRAVSVDAAGVEAMALGWLRSLEVPMGVSVSPRCCPMAGRVSTACYTLLTVRSALPRPP